MPQTRRRGCLQASWATHQTRRPIFEAGSTGTPLFFLDRIRTELLDRLRPVRAATAPPWQYESELDICPQFDYTCSLVRRVSVVIWRYSTDAESTALDEWELITRRSTVVVTTRARPLLEVRMVENVQHFRLESKVKTLSNWEMLGY